MLEPCPPKRLTARIAARFRGTAPGPDRPTTAMHLDTERCVRAVQAKDTRFDGVFFTAVLTTRIYCRPGCPVVPPKPENMVFHPSAAACQQAGIPGLQAVPPPTPPPAPRSGTGAPTSPPARCG